MPCLMCSRFCPQQSITCTLSLLAPCPQQYVTQVCSPTQDYGSFVILEVWPGVDLNLLLVGGRGGFRGGRGGDRGGRGSGRGRGDFKPKQRIDTSTATGSKVTFD